MQPGERLGTFTIEKELGQGAMGAVYLARHEETGRRVALKLMLAGLDSNPKAQARFEREADVLKQLRHPNVVQLVAIGKFRGRPFYAMEFIEGESLDRVLERRRRLGWQEAAEIAKQVCAALQHVHDKGILHRDLKPSNLMVTKDGKVKLTDFGIAKDLDRTALTSANYTVGTAAYMSPEQCRGEADIDHRTDLYSLGVVLFELIAGRRPFEADSPVQMLMKHLRAKPPRVREFAPDVPAELDSLIDQLLEKKRDHRPRDAKTVAQTLERILEQYREGKSLAADAVKQLTRTSSDEDKSAARAILTTRERKSSRRRWSRKQKEKLFTALGLSFMLMLIVGLVAYILWPDPDKPLREAVALYERGEALYKEGQTGEAFAIWYDAIRKLELVAGQEEGERANQARNYLWRIEAAMILDRLQKFLQNKETWASVERSLTSEAQRARKDLERIWAREFDNIEFAELARSLIAKLEVPHLIEEIQKLAHVQEPKSWPEARLKIKYFLERYAMRAEAQEAKEIVQRIQLRLDKHQFALDWLRRQQPREIHSHPVIETALQALEHEQVGQVEPALNLWQQIATLRTGQNTPPEWKRFVGLPDMEGWILLAEEKLQALKK
jgi:serine/threonine protein kinase